MILEHNDKLSQRLHYLEDLSILDGLDTERTMLDTAAPRALDIFPRRTVTEFMESSARFHQFIQHCSFPSAENVSYLLKKYTFEGRFRWVTLLLLHKYVLNKFLSISK